MDVKHHVYLLTCSDPQRPKSPSATTRTIDTKMVGTLPVRSNFCISQLALWTAVQNRVAKTESGEPAVETWSKALSNSLWEPSSTSTDRSRVLIRTGSVLFTSTKKPSSLLGTRSQGRPHRLSHSSWVLIRTGSPLCCCSPGLGCMAVVRSVLHYVRRDRTDY